MKTHEQKVSDQDDALLKRERSISFTRAAATCFAALLFVSFIINAIYTAKYAADADVDSILSLTTNAGVIDLKTPLFLTLSFFLWIAIAHEYNLKSKHIDSIKMYRSKLKTQTGTESSQQQPAP